MLARRKMATEGLLAAHHQRVSSESKHEEYAHGFLQKISALFDL
jgi:hypothetical protein